MEPRDGRGVELPRDAGSDSDISRTPDPSRRHNQGGSSFALTELRGQDRKRGGLRRRRAKKSGNYQAKTCRFCGRSDPAPQTQPTSNKSAFDWVVLVILSENPFASVEQAHDKARKLLTGRASRHYQPGKRIARRPGHLHPLPASDENHPAEKVLAISEIREKPSNCRPSGEASVGDNPLSIKSDLPRSSEANRQAVEVCNTGGLPCDAPASLEGVG